MELIRVTLPVDKLLPGMVIADYLSDVNNEGNVVVMVKPNVAINQKSIDRLKRSSIESVTIFANPSDTEIMQYIKKPTIQTGVAEPPKLKPKTVQKPKTIEILTKKPLDNLESISQRLERLDIELKPVNTLVDDRLREEAVVSIKSLFICANEGMNMTTAFQVVRGLDNIVDQLVETVSSEDGAIANILDLRSYDEYTYHHSLSVAVLSLCIGKGLGLSLERLKKLGQCAIMHDVGKTAIPPELINKAGKLTNEEFQIVRNHAKESGIYLEKARIGDPELWDCVTYHHEKLDGTGYPDRLKGDEIPLFSQIISVSDIYDAVTSYRSYRSPMPPSSACDLIMSECGRALNYDIVKVFMDRLELYPLNSIVELSDKRLGIVTDNTHSMRPILRMLDNGRELDLLSLDSLNLIITGVVDPKEAIKIRQASK